MTSPTPRARALALAGTMTALALTACGEDEPTNVSDDPSPTQEATSSSPTPTEETSSADPSPTDEPAADTATVPVYFVGEAPQGPRLFREFRQVPADNPLEEAAALLTAGDTLDPDYRTLFPGGAFADIAFDEAANAISATLPDDGWRTPAEGMSPAEARLAVQSLVYTLQGVAQTRAPVTVDLRGRPSALFGIDTAGGVKAAQQLNVLGLVNVTSPKQGAAVSGTFTAQGVASSFEATVPWQIREGGADGAVALDGFATAEGWIDRLYPWETEVDVSGLEPGDYTFVALTDDPSGGAEGFGPTEDTKAITIE